MRRMEHVGDVLRAFLQSKNLDKQVACWQVVIEWPRIVGEELAVHAEALEVRKGVLWLAVPSSNWRQHILFLKPQILRALSREFPGVRVSDIRCTTRRRDEQRAE